MASMEVGLCDDVAKQNPMISILRKLKFNVKKIGSLKSERGSSPLLPSRSVSDIYISFAAEIFLQYDNLLLQWQFCDFSKKTPLWLQLKISSKLLLLFAVNDSSMTNTFIAYFATSQAFYISATPSGPSLFNSV